MMRGEDTSTGDGFVDPDFLRRRITNGDYLVGCHMFFYLFFRLTALCLKAPSSMVALSRHMTGHEAVINPLNLYLSQKQGHVLQHKRKLHCRLI